MRMNRTFKNMGVVFMFIAIASGCNDLALDQKPNLKAEDVNIASASLVTTPGVVNPYVTAGDKSLLFQGQSTSTFTTGTNRNPNVELIPGSTFQSMDGFGYTMTEGSAYVLMTQMTSTQRTDILTEMFDPANGIGVSFLRIGIGATDLSTAVYTYDDLPAGQTDPTMSQFSLNGPDLTYLIPVLKQVLAIAPSIKVIATPWTAPSWMKTNNSSIGGSLSTAYYDAYATYFVKYLQAMQQQGISIYAITPQNEPENPNNNPSMTMTSSEQTNFILKLAPALAAANLSTKIIVFDHNCDNTAYPIAVLTGAAAAYTDGAAFHLYAGNISAMSTVHNSTGKNVYFTEQYTGSNGSFLGDLGWHTQNVMIGGANNWSKTGIEWNFANNSSIGPFTPGGCSTCLGALTIASNGAVTRNVAYYIIAHMSKFVRPGALRTSTTSSSSTLLATGFVNTTANGNSKVLVVYNNGQRDQAFNIKYNGQIAVVTLKKKSVGTYVWY